MSEFLFLPNTYFYLYLFYTLQEEECEARERAKEEGIFADMPTGAVVEDDPDDKLELESWKVGWWSECCCGYIGYYEVEVVYRRMYDDMQWGETSNRMAGGMLRAEL